MNTKRSSKCWKKLCKWLNIAWNAVINFFTQVYPGRKAWLGAGLGIGVVGYVFLILMAADVFLPVGWQYFLGIMILMPLVLFLIVAIFVGLGRLIFKLPAVFLILLGTGVLLAIIGFQRFDLSGLFIAGVVILLGGLLGACVSVIIRGRWSQMTPLRKVTMAAGSVLGILGVVLVILWLVNPWGPPDVPDGFTLTTSLPSLAETLPDPALSGEYSVKTLTYGSGTDQRRPEFAEGAAIRTEPVDGSPFISNWTPLRTAIWGFDPSELPINGRVWVPEGEGPFPLVLVVHGNHVAEDESDPGYAYLCDLLASRGYICVSVDENFLNGSGVGDLLSFRKLSGENDLRGWLLLEHLAFWQDLAGDPTSQFFGKVDLDQIALIGHSRGGEAIAVAALFNNLPNYPDDANIEFDYGFNIRSLVAIAPVDGQYQPAGEPIRLTDVNYLVLQGSHDMDLVSFDGLNLYERVDFTGRDLFFKSAIYIWGANHGQFNTTWGDNDVGSPSIWLFDRDALIPEEDQMQVAQVMVSAFLEATLKGSEDYLPLFQNIQTGRDWLPQNLYLNAYADSDMRYLVTFDEDVDVTTGTGLDIRISAQNLTTWKEDHMPTKWGEMDENGAVLLGWDRSGDDTAFILDLAESGHELEQTDQVVFSVAQGEGEPGQESLVGLVDFTVELVDSSGETAALPLSSVAPLQPQWAAEIHRLTFLSNEKTSEPILQTYLFSLDEFIRMNPDLDIDHLAQVRLVFNLTEEGEIWLDNLGFKVNGE